MGSALSDAGDEVDDPGGGPGMLVGRKCGASCSPTLSDGSNNATRGTAAQQQNSPTATSTGVADNEERGRLWSAGSGGFAAGLCDDDVNNKAPFFVTVAQFAQFCTLGGAEEGAPPSPAAVLTAAPEASAAVGGSSDLALAEGVENPAATAAAAAIGGGGGAVTPASLPALFPKGGAGSGGSRFALSGAVRMVISSSSADQHHDGTGAAPPPGQASAGMFSMHSVTTEDVIVRVRRRFVFHCLLAGPPQVAGQSASRCCCPFRLHIIFCSFAVAGRAGNV